MHAPRPLTCPQNDPAVTPSRHAISPALGHTAGLGTPIATNGTDARSDEKWNQNAMVLAFSLPRRNRSMTNTAPDARAARRAHNTPAVWEGEGGAPPNRKAGWGGGRGRG